MWALPRETQEPFVHVEHSRNFPLCEAHSGVNVLKHRGCRCASQQLLFGDARVWKCGARQEQRTRVAGQEQLHEQ